MKQLNYSVKGQRLYKSDPVYDYYLVKGSENYLALHFWFSKEWQSVNKFVKFAGDDNYKPITNDVCQIPDSVIDYDVIAFSVIGLNANDEVVITTNSTSLEYDLNANIEIDPEPQGEGKDKLSELDDVIISDPQDDQALFYDALLRKWRNKNLPSHSDKLSELTDVDLGEPTDGQFLAYDAENEEWTNADGMTASKVNQQIDDKLVPYSKVYNAVAIEYSESFLTLKAKINTTFSQPPFKLTDLIVLPISSAILNDQSPRYINILDVNDQSIGSFELSRRGYKMVDNCVYLIRINASNKVDIISSSVITSDNVSGLTALLNAKQNVLTQGTGIDLSSDTVSVNTAYIDGRIDLKVIDELTSLTDVNATGVTDGQILKYDSASQKWVNANESGGGGGADELTDLNDVNITSALDGQVLKYDSATQKWKNSAEAVGVDELTELSDVALSSPTNKQVLTYDSTSQKWENADGMTVETVNQLIDNKLIFDYNALDWDENVKGIAHRGYSAIAPENTLPAYKLARQMGFNYVEADVRITSDGVPVLLHDTTIDRTSDGTGSISSMTYAELQEYDFGSWKSPDYAGTKIPSLEEFLSLCRSLLLKPYIDFSGGGIDGTALATIMDLIDKSGIKDDVTFLTNSDNMANNIWAIDSTARVGIVFSTVPSNWSNWLGILNTWKSAGKDVFADFDVTDITAQIISDLIGIEVPLELWVVNVASDIVDLDTYVTGVTSNYLIAGQELYKSEALTPINALGFAEEEEY